MRFRLVWLITAGMTVLAGGRARADVIFQLEPVVGVGATDNANVTATGTERQSDSYTNVGGNARVSYTRQRTSFNLGYRVGYTQYLSTAGETTLTNNLALRGSAELSPTVKLGIGANATLSRASGVDPIDPTTAQAQAMISGTTQYLGTGASEELGFTPTPRQGFGQSLSVTQMRYLDTLPMANGMSLAEPTTTFIALGLNTNREMGLNQFSLSLDGGDSFRSSVAGMPYDPYADGHTFMGKLMAGWRREISPLWTATLQAGPSVIVKLDGSGVLAPAFAASANYAHAPWFASVSVLQSPSPNLFLGEATINDQAIARLALPITRSGRFFMAGWGGYTYARIADQTQHLTRLYDQFVGGLSLAGHISNWPLAWSLNYTVVSQRGSAMPAEPVEDLARQSLFFTLRGAFAWGPGTPPLFGGAL